MTSNGFSNENRPIKAIIICGPTGSGKSDVGMRLAGHYGGQIVSADSRQIYRRLDIGTAKPSPEDRAKISHHMIDVVDLTEDFTAKRYAEMAAVAVSQIATYGCLPIIVGGAGLYLSALTRGLFQGPEKDADLRRELEEIAESEGTCRLHEELSQIDPTSAVTISPMDRVRIIRALEVHRLTGQTMTQLRSRGKYARLNAQYLWIGLDRPRSQLYERIDSRVDSMISRGLLDEIHGLVRDGLDEPISRKKIVGYYEIMAAIQEMSPMEDAIDFVKQHSRNYAKRQLTWFRHKASVHWLSPESTDFYDKVFALIDEYFSKRA
jgi:tRNA dimethylallyltransferase